MSDSALVPDRPGVGARRLSRPLKRRAKALLGLSSVRHALTGAVAAIQRTDSSLRLNVHFHVLVLDGVYVRDATTRTLEFHSLPTPTTEEVADVALRTAQRLAKQIVDGRARRQLERLCHCDFQPTELVVTTHRRRAPLAAQRWHLAARI